MDPLKQDYSISHEPPENVEFNICGTDAKMQNIIAYSQPGFINNLPGFFSSLLDNFTITSTQKYIPITIKGYDHPYYVKMAELVQATGISAEEFIRVQTDPTAIHKLLSDHNRLIKNINDIISLATTVLTEQDRKNLTQFTLHQLQGRIHTQSALNTLKGAVESRKNILWSMIRAGGSGAMYVGKLKGTTPEPNLILGKDGDLYIGGAELGKGKYTKVSDIKSIDSAPFAGVKMVSRGERGVDALEKHLQIAEELNQKGVRNIPKTHQVKYLTKTKKGDPKLVAIVNKLDGDGEKVLERWYSAFHVCNILLDVSKALADMHKAGYVHSDLKPANILLEGDLQIDASVDPEGNLFVVGGVLHDFGLSGKIGQNIIGGSPYTLPPEVHSNLAKGVDILLSPEIDYFSLGVTIAGMAATATFLDSQGQRPFGYAVTDDEIKQRLSYAKSWILGRKMTNTDKLLRIRMLEIAEDLLKVNPKDRITAEQAEARLEGTIKKTLDDMVDKHIDPEIVRLSQTLPNGVVV